MSRVDCMDSPRFEAALSFSARGEGAVVLTGAIPSWGIDVSLLSKVGNGTLQSKLSESRSVSALLPPLIRAGTSSLNWRAFVMMLRG